MNKYPGDHGGGVTPVPISNTEVKSSSAKGTAYSFRGRLGHCRDINFYIQGYHLIALFFVFVIAGVLNR